jgi:integrase/recombinase XerD
LNQLAIPLTLAAATSEFLDALAGVRSPHTVLWYRLALKSLGDFLGDDCLVDRITTHDLRRWRSAEAQRKERWRTHPTRPRQRGELSPWTLNDHVRAVRRFFQWLADEALIRQNPARRLELPPLPDEPPKGISPADLSKILRVAEANPRDLALVLFLADTGARVGGVAGLRWEDVSLRHRCATVREKGRGGKRRSRTVYFGRRTQAALERWHQETHGSGPVFSAQSTNRTGQPLTECGIYQVLKRLARRAGVKARCNPHAFRHGFARGMLERGANLAVVGQLLGHRDPAITVRFYARYADQELRKAHDRYSWLDGERTQDWHDEKNSVSNRT